MSELNFDEMLASIEDDFELDELQAHILLDRVSRWTLERAADSWPDMTRDMVSRGQVKSWLLELAHGETQYL